MHPKSPIFPLIKWGKVTREPDSTWALTKRTVGRTPRVAAFRNAGHVDFLFLRLARLRRAHGEILKIGDRKLLLLGHWRIPCAVSLARAVCASWDQSTNGRPSTSAQDELSLVVASRTAASRAADRNAFRLPSCDPGYPKSKMVSASKTRSTMITMRGQLTPATPVACNPTATRVNAARLFQITCRSMVARTSTSSFPAARQRFASDLGNLSPWLREPQQRRGHHGCDVQKQHYGHGKVLSTSRRFPISIRAFADSPAGETGRFDVGVRGGPGSAFRASVLR